MERVILLTKPVITKEHFVNCINVLKESDDMARSINAVARTYGRGDFIDGYAFSDVDTEMKLIETLEAALNDKEHWISWFCIESDYGRETGYNTFVSYNGDKIEINSPESLYDFLVLNK